MRLLVVTAVEAEADAVLRRSPPTVAVHIGPYTGRRTPTPTGSATVLVGGIGPVAAAAATATALAHTAYDGVVSAGVAGGFAGRADIGGVVVASDSVIADLGAWSADGWLGLRELGWATPAYPAPAWARTVAARLGAIVGPVLTVSAVTGTDERALELAGRHAAVAEAMEGYAVAHVAALAGVAMLELRAVSNLVGRRDPDGWNLPAALDALADASAALLTVGPWPRV